MFRIVAAHCSAFKAGGCQRSDLFRFSTVFSKLARSSPRSRWLVFSCYLCCKPDLYRKVLDSWARSTHWPLYCILEELIVKAAIIYSFGGANTILSVYWPAKIDRWLTALRPLQSSCNPAIVPSTPTDVENASVCSGFTFWHWAWCFMGVFAHVLLKVFQEEHLLGCDFRNICAL